VFAEVVRAHRRRLGLTQEELAANAGLSVRAIRNLEAGLVGTPRPATVRLLADAFGLVGTDRERFCQTAAGAPADPPTSTHVPAQLPADVSAFTGRAEQLAQLDTLLAGIGDQPNAVIISALSGTAGVGKTALAVHWAHQVIDRFSDGQLYVNLRGYDPDQPMAPADALARFLTALGVAGPDIPQDLDDRAARYRSEIAGRRMLILLDNARSVEQVRPLLPGSSACTVVVTSRDSLAGLVAIHGAHRLDLDLLPPADAVALLRRLIGPRVDAEPDATTILAGQCARLPLALRVAAELATRRPTTPLTELIAELADQQRRLDLLDSGGDPHAAVKAVFSWSIQHLPADAVRVFRLLGLHPGPDADPYAAAALAGTGLAPAHRVLDLLARAHLVHPTTLGRYGMHDLLRTYAAGLTRTHDTDQTRHAALGRLFDYFLATAATAMDSLYPAEAHRRPRVAPPATPVPDLTDPNRARAWLDTERACLVAAAAHAAAHGRPTHTIQLSTTMHRYLQGGGHYHDALLLHGHAHRAAAQVGDVAGESHALRELGATYLQLGRYGLADDYLQRALAQFRQTHDQTGEAITLTTLGVIHERLGSLRPAVDHHERAVDLFRSVGDQTGEAQALNNLATAELRLRRYGPAADHLTDALALFRKLGNMLGEAHALNNLGLVEQERGDDRSAADHTQQALARFRKLGNLMGEARAMENLGVIHIHLGQPKQAADYFSQALTYYRETGDEDGKAWPLNGLGEAARAAGHPADALTYHTEALTIATETGIRDQQACAHIGLGQAHRALGDLAHARAHYEQALALCTDLDLPDAAQVRAYLAEVAEPPAGNTVSYALPHTTIRRN
jgi:tetratricopeptide (TPR) repeat protein/transcriptional regulator with XRE-family HTH domain